MASAARLFSGALAGAMLLALLSSAESALGPDETLGLGPLWIAGIGLGIWLGSWGGGLPRWTRRPLAVAWVLLLMVPLLMTAPLLLPDLSAGRVLESWFWSQEPAAFVTGSWRGLLLAAGAGVGLGLRRSLGLELLGGVLGVAGALALASRGWPAWTLVTPLVGTQVLVRSTSIGLRGWRLRRAGQLAAGPAVRELERRDFGWGAEEPSVLRPRLGGLMLFAMLAVASLTGWMGADLLGLVEALAGRGSAEPGALLVASGLALALGVGAGRPFLALARRMPGAELAPLCLLFATTTWWTTRSPESVQTLWFELGRHGQGWLPAAFGPGLVRQLTRTWEGLLWFGPSLFTAGIALVLLPRLAFTSSPGGARGGRRLVGTALLSLGLFVTTPVLELTLVRPGPALFLAAMVALAATSFFLVVDLRGQSVGAVGQRVAPEFSLVARSLAGAGLALVTWSLATSPGVADAPLGSLPGPQLARMLQAAELPTTEVTFHLADPATGQRTPFLERTNAASGELERWRRGGRELTRGERLQLRAAGSRLARLFGFEGEPVGDAPTWILELGAGGPDRLRVPKYRGTEQLVCLWLPLELAESEFTGGLDGMAREYPFATSWLVDGYAFVVGTETELSLDLARGAEARRQAASFVGQLTEPSAKSVGLGPRSVPMGPLHTPDALRRRARNLERLAAGRTPMPAAWGSLLGSFPEIAVGRALIDLRVAAAWVAYDRLVAPGSLALESWQRRLDGARLDAGLLAPEDPELLALDAEQRAESALFEVRSRLLREDPRAAVSLLLSVRETLAGRGDYEVILAAAFELAGNQGASRLTWTQLGARGPALLAGSQRWLAELGFAPAQ